MVSISSHILEVWRFRIRLDPGLSKAWLLSLTQLYLPPCGLYSQASSSQEVPVAPAIPLAASSKCLQWRGSTAFPIVPGKSLGRTPTGLQLDWLRSHAQPWSHQWGLGEMKWADGPDLGLMLTCGVRGEVSTSQSPQREGRTLLQRKIRRWS